MGPLASLGCGTIFDSQPCCFMLVYPQASSIVILCSSTSQQHLIPGPLPRISAAAVASCQTPTNVTGFANQPTRGRRLWLFWALIGVSALGIFGFAGGVRPNF
jgi:hypothetical protein